MVTGEGRRGTSPEGGRDRLVIDLRTPPGALSRGDLRRLREELAREVFARESVEEQAASARGFAGEPGRYDGQDRGRDGRRLARQRWDEAPVDPSGSWARAGQEPAFDDAPIGEEFRTRGGYPEYGRTSPDHGEPRRSPYQVSGPYQASAQDQVPARGAHGTGYGGPGYDEPGYDEPDDESSGYDAPVRWTQQSRDRSPRSSSFSRDLPIRPSGQVRDEWQARRPQTWGGARAGSPTLPLGDRGRGPDRHDEPERSGYRPRLTPRDDEGPLRDERVAPQRRRSSSSRLRPALLIRATVVVGLLAALAASLDRAGQDGTGVGANVSQTAAGAAQASVPAMTSAAPIVPSLPAGTVIPSSAAGSGPATGAQSPAPCHISYSVAPSNVNQYTVVMVIANTGDTKVTGWTLRWQYPPKQKILYAWNAMVTNGPNGAAATGIGLDQTITSGKSVTIGFVGQRDQWIPTPTGFALNGQLCQWEPTVTTQTGTNL